MQIPLILYEMSSKFIYTLDDFFFCWIYIPCLSSFVSLSLSICLRLSISFSLSFFFLSLSFSLSLSVFVSLCLSLSLSLPLLPLSQSLVSSSSLSSSSLSLYCPLRHYCPSFTTSLFLSYDFSFHRLSLWAVSPSNLFTSLLYSIFLLPFP